MVVSLTKAIPTSSWYTGGNASTATTTTIVLNGVQEITCNTKKALTKIPIPQAKGTQTLVANYSDKGKNYVLDLKRIEDTIKIRGVLEDDSTDSAWNKAWKLRAMCSSGGALTTFIIDNIQFTSATQQAFLEDVTFIAKPTDSGLSTGLPAGLDESVVAVSDTNNGIARIEVDLTFYIGNPR
jgi:hypothetical protein